MDGIGYNTLFVLHTVIIIVFRVSVKNMSSERTPILTGRIILLVELFLAIVFYREKSDCVIRTSFSTMIK